MLDPSEFRNLVSGRSLGAWATTSRGLLRAAEIPYTLAVNWRNRRYDRGRAATHRVSVPVVSVGNLTLGGTGKTPMVKWLARWFGERGVRVAIVSRGYGASAGKHNDEALELSQSLPAVPHVQNPDRVAAATRAIDEFGCQLVVLDDGFQHRRLARDLDIVLLDALEPFGYDHVFPRGTLREPVAGLRRAHVVCLSRSDVISAAERDAIRHRVAEIAPNTIWCELIHAASRLINSTGESQPLEGLAGQRVAAFCGIGNPAGFRHTLGATHCEIAAWRAFPDHHRYSSADLASLSQMINNSGATMAVCTQKDLVKVSEPNLGEVPLWAVAIEMQFQAGQDAFENALNVIRAPSHSSSDGHDNRVL
ncbi:MAG: tetraacyldisaccharide 4'-kinase [Planctomycetes bacterium]|nr:tetraacyldisaccharide 4'-kinase [Planctomycetota bacterium]